MILFEHPPEALFAGREKRANIVIAERAPSDAKSPAKPSRDGHAYKVAVRGDTPSVVHRLPGVPTIAAAMLALSLADVQSGVRASVSDAILTVPQTDFSSFAVATGGDFLAQLEARIESFLRLEDGWNGRRSKAPNQIATRFARLIAETFADRASWYQVDNAPQVAPLDEGGYQFEWRNGSRELYVSCSNEARIEVLEVDGDIEEELEAGAYTGINNHVKPAIARLLRA